MLFAAKNREEFSWEPMTPDMLTEVNALGDGIHTAYPEGDFVFEERLHLYPEGCFVLRHLGKTKGYVISHPWLFDNPPALNCLLGAIPLLADTLYIHDLAIAPEARNSSNAQLILSKLEQHARSKEWASLSCISVNHSDAILKRRGFRVRTAPHIEKKLKSYEPEAKYMTKNI